MSLGAALGPLAAIVLSVATADAGVVDRVAAVVNDDVIVLSEVYDLGSDYIEQKTVAGGGTPAARRLAELEVVESLVQRRLISQEITRLGLDVTDLEMDRTIDDIASRNGMDRDTLKAEVEKTGLPWAEYKLELRENLRQMKFNEAVIRPRIAVDEDELLDAYKRLVNSADRPMVAELGAIFLSVPSDATDEQRAMVRATARTTKARIDGGEDFAKVAAEVDQGPYGAQGGKMGSYKQGELVGTLDEVAFSLTTGQTSEPIDTPQGVFLLHAFSVAQEGAAAFEDVRDKLFDQVYSERIESEVDQWYNGARRQAAVLIKLESPDPAL
jgi:peptidyl-prolyl cis-trans isomerase SurA